MQQPLAYRVRPTTLNDVLGQQHILGEDKFLSNMLNNNTQQLNHYLFFS